jgi:hypothetical protein
LKHFCKSYEINQITEKENRKELEKQEKASGDQIGPVAEAAPAQYHLNPKGYLPSPFSHR